MKTQSPDTSLDAELVLIRMIRNAPISKRFAFAQSWMVSILEAGIQYMQQLHPQANDDELKLLFIERQYGKSLTDELRKALSTHKIQVANIPQYQEAIYPLNEAFKNLHIPYALSGSLASSLYGMQRATLQLDLIADTHQKHISPFCNLINNQYLFSREDIEVAIQQKTQFTLVHLASLLKVVVTLPKTPTPMMGQHIFHGKREIVIVEGQPPISVLSPEQLILLLLEAFKQSNEKADDTWYDLLGILKVQGTDLDMSLLMQQSSVLDIKNLLLQALVDAGLQEI